MNEEYSGTVESLMLEAGDSMFFVNRNGAWLVPQMVVFLLVSLEIHKRGGFGLGSEKIWSCCWFPFEPT